MEELASTVGGLCQDYCIPVGTDSLPQLSTYLCMLRTAETASTVPLADPDPLEDEEFHKFCQSHTYLRDTSSRHFGYSTLPPNRGERRARKQTATPPKRSQSYEGCAPSIHTTLSFRENSVPRKSSNPSNPQTHAETYAGEYYYKKLQFEVPYQGNYHARPLSYQEISYDENDYEENSPSGSWSELSCP